MQFKNNTYICISKNDKYLSNTSANKHYYLHTNTYNVNAKETFIYGQNQQSLIVSTLNEDGKTLTPKWKYEYQYDTLGTMTEKKAYRWDAEQMTWTPAYLLTWKTEGPTLQKLSENK